MPRIAGKAYPKPKKRDPKEPVWENGILCRRQGKRWTQGEVREIVLQALRGATACSLPSRRTA